MWLFFIPISWRLKDLSKFRIRCFKIGYDFGILLNWQFMSSLAIFYLPRYSLPLGYSFVLLTVGDSIGSAINFSTSFFEFSKMTWPLKVRIFQKIFERYFPKMNAKLYSEVQSGWIFSSFFGKGIWCKAIYDMLKGCFFGKKTAFEIFWPSAIDEIMTKVARTITTLILLLSRQILKKKIKKNWN